MPTTSSESCAAKTIGGQFGERNTQRGIDLRRHRFTQCRNEGRGGRHDAREDRLYGRSREWRFASQHFVRHRAQGIDVCSRVHGLLAHGLLGRHVLRRAETESRLRHALATGLLHRQGDAEVGDEGMAALQSAIGSCVSRCSRARSVSPSTNGIT